MLSKVFKAYDVRSTYPKPLDEKVAWKIGHAAGKYMLTRVSARDAADPMMQHVVVGRDMRPSSPKLAEALISGLRAANINVIDVGMVDTSFIYFAINYLECLGGIMTTASHNPIEYNGFKICGLEAKPIGSGSGLEEIQRIAATLDGSETGNGRVEERDLWEGYREHVHQFLDIKRPLKVVIDAANGMGGKMVPALFDGVENLEIIPINFEITGKFVHEPNPLVPENMVPTQEGVKKHKADLGVSFDGDADRCIVTDEQGNLVGCDLLGAMMCGKFLEQYPGSAIVYDLRSSKALKEAAEAQGGTGVRGRVGHVFMKQVMRESNASFGAELSGHIYYKDSFNTDSGAVTFASILSILSASDKKMSELIAPHAKYLQSGERNFKNDQKDETIAKLEAEYKNKAEIDHLDGITIDCWDKEGWWFNVRKSNTEPYLRLNMEAKDQETLDALLEEVQPKLGKLEVGH